MKVLVLGGAGGMGREAAARSLRFDFVESVTVADLDGSAVERVAKALGGKARSCAISVEDRAAMRDAIGAHDVVLNTVGPFYRFGVPVLEQVIEAGRDYADICDDWEPTLDMLALSERARARGVRAIIGLGASPGVTNLLALRASRQLDEVKELITGWSIEGGSEELPPVDAGAKGPPASMVHLMQQMTGTIRVLQDGRFENVRPLQRRVIEYPGHGSLPVWSVGHPEAITLPRAFPGLTTCTNVMIGPSDAFEGMKALADAVEAGEISLEQAAAMMIGDMPETPRKSAALNARLRMFPTLFGWASGRHGGRPAVAVAQVRAIPGGMATATSAPLALALPILRDHMDGKRGIFTPEEIVDPATFLNLLAPCWEQDASRFVECERLYLGH